MKDIAFGIGLALTYGLAGYLNFLWAMRSNGASFMVVALGGMLVRMVVAFLLVAAGVLLWDIQEKPFFLAFISTFVVALSLEITAMHKGWGVRSEKEAEKGIATENA